MGRDDDLSYRTMNHCIIVDDSVILKALAFTHLAIPRSDVCYIVPTLWFYFAKLSFYYRQNIHNT